MDRLRMTTCMAPGMDDFCRQLTTYVASRLGQTIDFVIDIDWTERYRQLDEGTIHIAWICGAPYVVRRPQGQITLLAAPVWRGDHYGDRPVYHSDIMVHRDHPAQTFGQVRGQRWAYNEPGSLSGYHVMRAHLARLGEELTFFSQAIEAGYHRRALQMLATGEADVAAIDTTVFEQIVKEQPTLRDAVRSLGRLGPNPAPPWVIRTEVPVALREVLTAIFTTMTKDTTGAALLAASPLTRFAQVDDTDYDPAATMVTHSVGLG
jgi:phosphonate transport system substrate-binding protein